MTNSVNQFEQSSYLSKTTLDPWKTKSISKPDWSFHSSANQENKLLLPESFLLDPLLQQVILETENTPETQAISQKELPNSTMCLRDVDKFLSVFHHTLLEIIHLNNDDCQIPKLVILVNEYLFENSMFGGINKTLDSQMRKIVEDYVSDEFDEETVTLLVKKTDSLVYYPAIIHERPRIGIRIPARAITKDTIDGVNIPKESNLTISENTTLKHQWVHLNKNQFSNRLFNVIRIEPDPYYEQYEKTILRLYGNIDRKLLQLLSELREKVKPELLNSYCIFVEKIRALIEREENDSEDIIIFPSEKIQNIIKSENKELYKKILACFGNQWHVFVKFVPDFYLFFHSQPNRTVWMICRSLNMDKITKSVALITQLSEETEKTLIDAIMDFFKIRTKQGKHFTQTTIDVTELMINIFVNNAENKKKFKENKLLTKYVTDEPVKTRGDFVRFLGRHPDYFGYNRLTYIVSLKTNPNHPGAIIRQPCVL